MSYIIAEVGGNHDGDLQTALELVRQASEAGADAVKFQTYSAESLVHPDLQALPQAKGYDRQIDRFRDLEFSLEQWAQIVNECKRQNIDFLTTCFDVESLQAFLPSMKMIKIASGDLTYAKLLRAAAETGKPVLLSTGMANLEEIKDAARFFPPDNLTVMHCVSLYPCSDEDANLGVIRVLQETFPKVGYSDHTTGITACIAAAGMRCEVIEKHFTHDKTLSHGDHPISADANELSEIVFHVKRLQRMLGTEKPAKDEYPQRHKFRRGAYASRPIRMGQVISEQDVIYLRPENTINPIGRRARKNHKRLEPIA